MRQLFLLLVITLGHHSIACGQAVAPPKMQGDAKKQIEVVKQHFERITAQTGDSDEELEMIPVLFWNAPSRGASDGKMVTVLFVHDGRPEIACCVYPPIPSARMVHEFGSLSSKPVSVKVDGAEVWNPRTPGVEFEEFDSAPVPANSKAARMSQMKLLARQFDLKILWRGTQREKLRLLPQPLYRYKANESSELIDGAVFCFVMGGVDPEALLLIEAVRAGENEKPEWRYAFARRSSAQITATHRKGPGQAREVWSTTQLRGTGRRDPFIQVGVAAK